MNLEWTRVPKKRDKMFADIFNTLLELRWRYTLAVFSLSYIMSWLLFAVLYMIEPAARGHIGHRLLNDTVLCFGNTYTYVDIIMFSVETQSTIGYGFR